MNASTTERPSNNAPILVIGGASIHVARFVRGLCAAGRQVVLVTHSELPMGPLPGLCEQIVLDLSDTSWSAVRRIRSLVRSWSPAVIHVHQANGAAWHAICAARGVGLPTVVTLWGSDVLRLHEWNWLHQWMVRYALRAAAAWTADAHVLLETAGRICGPTPAVLREWIPIGIDAPLPLPVVVRERRVLSCRLHKPLYRIDSILRAFARLPKTRAEWVLEVAAAGDQTNALRCLATELGLGTRVEFTGMLTPPELALAYRRSAIFVSVPESDGTSVSLLESMGAGCLPVLSDLPANREWVHDGVDGLLVDDLDRLDASLLHAMAWCESGRWEREGRPLNEQRVAKQAMFPDNIRQFVALYERLAGIQ